jgi:hypothetical protein
VGGKWFPPQERAPGERRSRLRSLEEPFPALEQGLELVARMSVSRQHLDIVPVFREAPLELGDGRFMFGDLRLDSLELRGTLRPDGLLARLCTLRVRRRGRWRGLASFTLADILRPAAVVGVEPAAFDRNRSLGDCVEERAVV